MADTGRNVTVGGMIGTGFDLLQRQAAWFGALALVSLALRLLQLFERTAVIGGSIGSGLMSIVVAVASFIASLLITREIMAREGLMAAGTPLRIGTYLGVTIVFGLAIGLGFLLLVVPGFLILLRWFLAPYFVLARGTGFKESLAASSDATKGHRGTIFGLFVVLGVAYFVIFGGVAVATGGFQAFTDPSAGLPIVVLVVQAALGAVVGAQMLGIFATLADRTNVYGDVFG